ncbi:unnamed protein product [Ixodes hexagonus]
MGSAKGKSTSSTTGTAKEKKFRKCFVAGCKTGHGANASRQKISLYRLPRNAEKRQAWARCLQRDVQTLRDTTHVCELHFEPRYVQRDFVHIIDGKEVRMARDKPTLTSDAVPTIFPNGLPGQQPPPSFSPSPKSPEELSEWRETLRTTDEQRSDPVEQGNDIYVAETVVTGQTVEKETNAVAADETKTVVQETKTTAVQENNSPAVPRSGVLSGQEMLLQLRTPAECWSCLRFPSFKGAVYVSSWFNDLSSEVITEKTVVFRPQKYPDVNCQVYIGRTLVQECTVTTVEAAEEVLAGAGETELCKGAASHSEWKELRSLLTGHMRNSLVPGRPGSGAFFSKGCTTTVSKPYTACSECKYIRRNMLTRKSRSSKRKVKEKDPSDIFPVFEVITVDESVYQWVSSQEAAKE